MTDDPHDDENTPASAEEEAYQRRLWAAQRSHEIAIDTFHISNPKHPNFIDHFAGSADDLKKRDRGE